MRLLRTAACAGRRLESDEWIDLRKVFNAGWTTDEGSGLKHVAEKIGFEWPVVDPGGGLSMVLHAQAVDTDHSEHEQARQWLLDYNRGDVQATLAIRNWLAEAGAAAPMVPGGQE